MRVFLFILALAAGTAQAQTGADRVETLVQMFRQNRPSAQDITLSEAEVNAYLALRLPSKAKEIKRASANFKDGHVVEAEASVSLGGGALDRLPADTPTFVRKTLERLLKSDSTVQVDALFTSARGKGFVQIRRVEINGIKVPDSFVREAMEFAGAKARPPVDFNRLFPLPDGLDKVEVLAGAVRVVVKP